MPPFLIAKGVGALANIVEMWAGNSIGQIMAPDPSKMKISYTGTIIDSGVVNINNIKYRLLQLNSSGTLTIEEEVSADIWMCGGGASGSSAGGGGGYVNSGSVILTKTSVAVVGASGGNSSFMGIVANRATGSNGGSGGGGYGDGYRPTTGGSGAGITTYPFEDSSYFQHPHCAGGGGYSSWDWVSGGKGGTGGSNGSNGGGGYWNYGAQQSGGAGGDYGGGMGRGRNAATDGTYYGAGGGGGGGAGYQGTIYIRIPIEQ